jgi:hypothetical protein
MAIDHSPVAARYNQLIQALRSFITKAERERKLSTIEYTKAAMLGLMRSYVDMCSSPVTDEERLAELNAIAVQLKGALSAVAHKDTGSPSNWMYYNHAMAGIQPPFTDEET